MKFALKIPGPGGQITVDPGVPVPKGGLSKLTEIISVLIEVAIVCAFFFALYQIAHGAFNIMTSGGDKERFAQGRERLRFAIIGLLVTFACFLIINLLEKFFGMKLLGIN